MVHEKGIRKVSGVQTRECNRQVQKETLAVAVLPPSRVFTGRTQISAPGKIRSAWLTMPHYSHPSKWHLSLWCSSTGSAFAFPMEICLHSALRRTISPHVTYSTICWLALVFSCDIAGNVQKMFCQLPTPDSLLPSTAHFFLWFWFVPLCSPLTVSSLINDSLTHSSLYHLSLLQVFQLILQSVISTRLDQNRTNGDKVSCFLSTRRERTDPPCQAIILTLASQHTALNLSFLF